MPMWRAINSEGFSSAPSGLADDIGMADFPEKKIALSLSPGNGRERKRSSGVEKGLGLTQLRAGLSCWRALRPSSPWCCVKSQKSVLSRSRPPDYSFVTRH
jgi:hypothetical protein